MKKCIFCNVKLNEKNWRSSDQKGSRRICIICSRERGRRYYYANHERNKKRGRKFYWKNHKKIMKQGKNQRMKLRKETINHYGGKCKCCEEERMEFLTIDHPKNNGTEERKKFSYGKAGWSFYKYLKKKGYPDGYEVLCMNCNASRSWWGFCPHELR